MDDLSVTEPAAAGGPASAVTLSMPVVSEACAQCAAPLAGDQRYCLHCGEPRPHVGGPLPARSASETAFGKSLGGSTIPPVPPGSSPGGPATPSAPPGSSPGGPAIPLTPPGSSPAPPAIPGASSATPNNSLALIAGVGVLLLSMGVGVLIGRAGAGSSKAPPAQVITIGGGASTPTTTTPTTTTPETPAEAAKKKKEEAAGKAPRGTGSSITKPAPPSAAKNLRSGGSGQSYEQRSKALPNVVSTG